MDGGKEALFEAQRQGRKVASWIQTGHRYDFVSTIWITPSFSPKLLLPCELVFALDANRER
jgi:hypothetical protein